MAWTLRAGLPRAACASAAVLVLPLVATLLGLAQWGPLDVVVAWVLLTGLLAGATGLASWLRGRSRVRLAALVALATAGLLAWGELAVGLFGTPIAGS